METTHKSVRSYLPVTSAATLMTCLAMVETIGLYWRGVVCKHRACNNTNSFDSKLFGLTVPWLQFILQFARTELALVDRNCNFDPLWFTKCLSEGNKEPNFLCWYDTARINIYSLTNQKDQNQKMHGTIKKRYKYSNNSIVGTNHIFKKGNPDHCLGYSRGADATFTGRLPKIGSFCFVVFTKSMLQRGDHMLELYPRDSGIFLMDNPTCYRSKNVHSTAPICQFIGADNSRPSDELPKS